MIYNKNLNHVLNTSFLVFTIYISVSEWHMALLKGPTSHFFPYSLYSRPPPRTLPHLYDLFNFNLHN